jgi:hypothetical protein
VLRRLTIGLVTLACAAAIAACSSGNSGVPAPTCSGCPAGTGPNFATNTIYVADTTQNVIDIFTPSPGPSATPQYAIGGSNTSLNGPQYLAFDSSKRLYATNYNASTTGASVTIYQTFATGNVLPFGSITLPNGQHPYGIAMIPGAGFAYAASAPGGFFTSVVNIFGAFANGTAAYQASIAGTNTKLSNPIGVAVDAKTNIYVANSGSGTITVYPTPTPVPSPTGSPTATPSPTPTPSSSPSGSPSPTPTPASQNFAPSTTITCTCLKQPTGLALDTSGNLYVTDPASNPPAVYVFNASTLVPGTMALTPLRILTATPAMMDPTDVKVDSSGNVYVIDAGSPPASPSMLYIFPAGASAPSTVVTLPAGTSTGLALSP